MKRGLVFDTRAWKIDFTSSPFWTPEKHGVQFTLSSNMDVKAKGHDFVLATEVWEIPMRKTLKRLGLPVVLAAREPLKTNILKDAMFTYEHFKHEGEYYLTPDVVLAAGQAYADLWEGKTKTIVTGYPRFDYYANQKGWPSKEQVAKKHGLDASKKWVFFPSYPPYHYKKVDGKDTMVDLFDAREETLCALEKFAERNPEYQVVVKIHPASMKPFKKGTGKGNEVAGKLLERYKSPTAAMKVVGDIRNSGIEAKELLINSSIICGFTSTMLLEAALIGKPAVHILFGNTKDLGGIPEYAEHIPVAHDLPSLWSLLHITQTKFYPSLAEMAERYLYKVDGKACQRICEAVKSL